MATKTLGVKFEVAGIKEAQAGLNKFKVAINAALSQNKKAISAYQKDVKRGFQAG